MTSMSGGRLDRRTPLDARFFSRGCLAARRTGAKMTHGALRKFDEAVMVNVRH